MGNGKCDLVQCEILSFLEFKGKMSFKSRSGFHTEFID